MAAVWEQRLRQLVGAFGQMADQRRAVTPSDPAAEVLAYAARELAHVLDEVTAPGQMLTVEQFAATQVPRVDPRTVRRWIRAGELDAVRAAGGWKIPVRARRRTVPLQRAG